MKIRERLCAAFGNCTQIVAMLSVAVVLSVAVAWKAHHETDALEERVSALSPTAVPARGPRGVRLRWHTPPFEAEMDNPRDFDENGERFAERAGADATAMLKAFPTK